MDHAHGFVAVVDDEVALRKAIGRALRLADYEVAQYGSGEEFIDSLAERLPDCAVVDVHMPGISGFDVESSVRSQVLRIPFVLITASDEPTLDRQAEAIGVRLLRKPFLIDELLEAVRLAIGSHYTKAQLSGLDGE